VRNTFTRNSFSGNAGLAIDLNRDAITTNDAGDVDAGPNDLLNFPVLTDASIAAGQVIITGETRPGSTVEFFTLAADPLGHGEGVTFLGSGVEGSGSDSNGAAGSSDPTAEQFTFSLPIGPMHCGDPFSATATDPSGNTSEFALNFLTPYCSLLFDGGDDIVRTVNLPALTTYTVEAWVKRTSDSGGRETFVSDADSTNTAGTFALSVDGNDLDCPGGPADEFILRQIQPFALLCSGMNADIDSWYHIAVSRDGSGIIRLFVGGNEVASSGSSDPADSSGVLTFGRAGSFNGEYFPGYIAEVRVANSALYTADFTEPSGPLSPGPNIIGLWYLDEGSGQSALDSSGYLRHGVLGSTPAAEGNDPVWSSDHPY
jgi:hypothetical protein